MANNYMQFSTMVECTPEQAKWLGDKIDSTEDDCFSCSYEIEKSGIWLYAEDSFDLDGVEDRICAFQKEFDLQEPIVITWAEYCSKLRLDEFGGGCAVFYKGKGYYFYTHQWADQKIKELKNTKGSWYCTYVDRGQVQV